MLCYHDNKASCYVHSSLPLTFLLITHDCYTVLKFSGSNYIFSEFLCEDEYFVSSFSMMLMISLSLTSVQPLTLNILNCSRVPWHLSDQGFFDKVQVLNTYVILGHIAMKPVNISLYFSSTIVDGKRFVPSTALGHRQLTRIFLDMAVGSKFYENDRNIIHFTVTCI